MKLICEDCKIKKLKQIDVRMTLSIGYVAIGKCSCCSKNNEELYSYKENN